MDFSVQNTLEEFFAKYRGMRYGLGEVILRQDEVPRGIELIQSGYVRMYRTFEDGSELTINIFKPGSFFPMVWAICDLPNPYYFRALTPVTTRRGSREEVVEFVRRSPPVLYELTKRLLSGYYGLLLHTEKLLTGSAYQKVVSVLVMLVKRFGKRVGGRVVIGLKFSHQDIADFAHLSRETTSIQMKKLKDEGLVVYLGRQIVIPNLGRLECQLAA